MLSTKDAKPQEVNADTDTKATILARLGNPSVKSTFDEDIDNDTWFYINSVRQRYAYLRPQIEERTITAISFNIDGQVIKVGKYGIEVRRTERAQLVTYGNSPMSSRSSGTRRYA